MRFFSLFLAFGAAATTVSAAALPQQDKGLVSESERSVEVSNSMSAAALSTVDHTDISVSNTKAARRTANKRPLKLLDFTKSDPESIARGRAEALTLSPTSAVEGKHFNRYVQIFLENTDFESAAANADFQWLTRQGITLTNYKGVAHPSQPNYIAAVSGSTHNVNSGRKAIIKGYALTIVDLLEPKGISWGLYQEDMPYSGFQTDFFNPVNKRYDYVRKHNPLISFERITSNPESLAKIKNFTMFDEDLKNDKLPQWMFITPNMTNCGHDSSVRIAGNWVRSFIEPLLNDPHFMKDTVVVLTFDEAEKYLRSNHNKVFTVVFGDAVPKNLWGTKDDDNYSHYSNLATVEENWDLGRLGGRKRGDAFANVFAPFRNPNSLVYDKDTPVPVIFDQDD